MVDPTMSQLAFDPTPQGPPQSFQGPAPTPGIQPQDGSNPQWQAIMQAAQRGQISPQQLQQLAQKLGYQPPQQGGQQQQQQQPSQQNQNIGAQLGTAAGQMVGGAAKRVMNYMMPPAAAQGSPPPANGAIPSPAWDQ